MAAAAAAPTTIFRHLPGHKILYTHKKSPILLCYGIDFSASHYYLIGSPRTLELRNEGVAIILFDRGLMCHNNIMLLIVSCTS